MIRDIKPRSPITRLRRDFSDDERARQIDVDEALAVIGFSRSFLARALGYSAGSRPKRISLDQVLDLLDVDGYQETFVPRSAIPDYLLNSRAPEERSMLPLPDDDRHPLLEVGDALQLLPLLPKRSVQCVVTSSPYWGMRVYDNVRDVTWADGERCPYGFEQTPEGFIRHSVELLYLIKPAMAESGSVWWNIMDTYNTRTPIRGSSKEKLRAMSKDPDHAVGWTEHDACRHSAGHMYLDDGELASIPMRIAERASRIGFTFKSLITWNKNSTPEPVKSRVTRQAEYIVHLAVGGRTPSFDKKAWQDLEQRLGGRNHTYESAEKLADVWSFPTAGGKNGHGAEFPLALPGRCIALTSNPGDLVLDPFVGSGTSALAAIELGRRFIGFDMSGNYVDLARTRIGELVTRIEQMQGQRPPDPDLQEPNGAADRGNGRGGSAARPFLDELVAVVPASNSKRRRRPPKAEITTN